MPVKTSGPKAQQESNTQKSNQLAPEKLKLIKKLAVPLAKQAGSMKQLGEELEQTTFQLFNGFRSAVRDELDSDKVAARALGVAVMSSVYDIPTTAIRLDGKDTAVLIYPEKYTDKKGKEQKHPKAGKVLPDDASDDDKEIAVHPTVKGAAALYQRISRLIKVAIPEDDRAKDLVDEALDEDGNCQCTEPQLYALATGASREIVPKGSQGGQRTTRTWDSKLVTAEIQKILEKGWNGDEIVPGYKGENTLEELGECVTAALNNITVVLEKATKAAKKAASNGKGSTKAQEEESED